MEVRLRMPLEAARDALIATQAQLTRLLAAQNARLAGQVADLAGQVERVERLASRSSGNSSMPPSADDLPGRTPGGPGQGGDAEVDGLGEVGGFPVDPVHRVRRQQSFLDRVPDRGCRTPRLRRWMVAAAGAPTWVRAHAPGTPRMTAGLSSAVTGRDAAAIQSSAAAMPAGGERVQCTRVAGWHEPLDRQGAGLGVYVCSERVLR
jgi:hypothetical protein